MKKLLLALLAFSILGFYSCDTEPVGNETLRSVDSTATIDDDSNMLKDCIVVDADRCPFTIGGDEIDQQPMANMWWPGFETDYFNPASFFASTDSNNLTFKEYEDGTAHISGTTAQVEGGCIVEVDVWLKNRTNWTDWSAAGGDHKKEGCAGNASNEAEMYFYVIDSEKSTLTATGEGCLGEGTFGLEQRPDPNDPATPNFGAHVGPGGANYDSEIGADGLSTWGWITDIETGERLWIMDFNFKFDCEEEKEGGCETAFARGNDGNTCFIGEGFSRWGWTIGPLSEGAEETFEIYAGAGQCDIDKGTLVGTVDVSYIDGEVSITYNIDDDYEVEETHSYAGNAMFPINKKGEPTVAPGQYSIQEDLSGDVYVIAHAVVCGEDLDGDDDDDDEEDDD